MKNTQVFVEWRIYDLSNPKDLNNLKLLVRENPKVKKEFKCPFCENQVWVNLNKSLARNSSMYFKHLSPSKWCYFYNPSNIKRHKYRKISLQKYKFIKNKEVLYKNLKRLKNEWIKIFLIFSTLCHTLFYDFLDKNYFDDFVNSVEYLVDKGYFYKSNIDEKELALEIILVLIDRKGFIKWTKGNKYTLLYANKFKRDREKKLCIFKDTIENPLNCKSIQEIFDNIDLDNLTKSDIYWEKYVEEKFKKLIDNVIEKNANN